MEGGGRGGQKCENTMGTYDKINSIREYDIINEHKEYLSNLHSIKLNSKMETLPLIYWIPKMHKNPLGSRFTIASQKCTLKPLLEDITVRIFHKRIEKQYSKNRIWSGVKRFWVIQNNKLVIDSINKLNSHKKVKQVSTLIFIPCPQKIVHDQLLQI